MAQDRYSQNRQLAYDLLKKEGYTDIGDSAEELFSNKKNSEIAYDLLTKAGYTDIGKDYNEFAGLLYAPEEPSATPQPAEQKPAKAQAQPVSQPAEVVEETALDREALVNELKGAAETDLAFVEDYDKRYKKYQADVDSDLSGPDVDAQKKWLDDNNEQYRLSKKRVEELQGRINLIDKPQDIERIEAKKSEVRSHINPQDIIARGITPFGTDATGKKNKESEDTANYEAAREIYNQAEQTLEQGSKYDPGYEGGALEQAWTATKQFVGGAVNNIDMGSLTFGASEGTSLIRARQIGDKSNDIVNSTLKEMKVSDEDVNNILKSVEEDGQKLTQLSGELNTEAAELETMAATLEDMRRRGESAGRIEAYTKKYNAKVKSYNAKLKNEYQPLYSAYEKNVADYEGIMSAVDAALEDGLSDSEKAVLDALGEFTDAKIKRSSDVSVASAAGAGAEQSAEFMLDFILTGGLSKAGAKAATKLTTKRVLKKFGADAAKKVTAPSLGAQMLTDLGIAAERTAIMFPRSLSAYGEQLTQMTGKDAAGRYNFDRSHLNAALNTALTQYVEYWSEGVGEYLAVGEQAIFRKAMKTAPRTAIGQTLRNYRGTIGTYLDKGKFNGMFNEMFEEVVGSAVNALAGWMSSDRVGDKEAMKDFFSGEQLATLALSFLPMSVMSAGSNLRAYNQMKNRYDESVRTLNPFIATGAISREELNELVSDIENKTPQEIAQKIEDISDKARKANGGALPANFAQSLFGYVEGTFSMDLNAAKWEGKEPVINAYSEHYENADVMNAWDLNQAEEKAKAALIENGWSEEDLDRDAFTLAELASNIDSPELEEYAQIKAANAGLEDGYFAQVGQYNDSYANTIRENCDLDGKVIIATGADGVPVFITSKDAVVGPNGRLTTPTGVDGLVSWLVPENGTTGQAKANDFIRVDAQPTNDFIEARQAEVLNAAQVSFEQLKNTISPDGKARAINEYVGRTILVQDEAGNVSSINVVNFDPATGNATIKDEKTGAQMSVPATSLYDMAQKDANGEISLDPNAKDNQQVETAAPAPTAQAGTPAEDLMGEMVTINLNGKPTEVTIGEVGDGAVGFYYTDENGEERAGTMSEAEFAQAMQSSGTPAETKPAEAIASARAQSTLPFTSDGSLDWKNMFNVDAETFAQRIPELLQVVNETWGNEALNQAMSWYQNAKKQLEGINTKTGDPAKDFEAAKKAKEVRQLVDNYAALITALRPAATPKATTTAPAAAEAPAEAPAEENVPDVSNDTPKAAQQRGYIMENGNRIDRAAEDAVVAEGDETNIAFTKTQVEKGHYGLAEADRIIPSHIADQENLLHFFARDWQPKDRKRTDSAVALQQMANNLRPEEITRGATAYGGAPIINKRGEVIQGNGRSEGLRRAYAQNTAEGYKTWLAEHAEDFGLTAEQVQSMKNPVLVRVLDVDDETAEALGQKTQGDLESGGSQTINGSELAKKLGDKLGEAIDILFGGDLGDDATIADYVDKNGLLLIKWLYDNGFINDTEVQNAYDDKGRFTDTSVKAFKEMSLAPLFASGTQKTKDGFELLKRYPKLAIEKSIAKIVAFPELVSDLADALSYYYDYEVGDKEGFQKAEGSVEDAWKAIQEWMLNLRLDDGKSEAELHPSLVANHLAAILKGTKTSKSLVELFDAIVREMQGEENLFGTTEAVGRIEAYKNAGVISEQEANELEKQLNNGTESDNGAGAESVPAEAEPEQPGDSGVAEGSGEIRTAGEGANRGEQGEAGEPEGEVKTGETAAPAAKPTTVEEARAYFENLYGKGPKADKAVRVWELTHKESTAPKGESGPMQSMAMVKAEPALSAEEAAELESLGIQLAVDYITDDGFVKFPDFFKNLVETFGDGIRPFAKSIYLGASAKVSDEIADQMDDRKAVRDFDENIDINDINNEQDTTGIREEDERPEAVAGDTTGEVGGTAEPTGDSGTDTGSAAGTAEGSGNGTVAGGNVGAEQGTLWDTAESDTTAGSGERNGGRANDGRRTGGRTPGNKGGRTGSSESDTATRGGGSEGRDTLGSREVDPAVIAAAEEQKAYEKEKESIKDETDVDKLKARKDKLKAEITKITEEHDLGKARLNGQLRAIVEKLRELFSKSAYKTTVLNQEKIPYESVSDPTGEHSIGSVVPSGAADAMSIAVKRVEAAMGKTSAEFVREELGYKSLDEMFTSDGKDIGLSGEQVDGVALAISQMKRKRMFIVGDMTGVGKGRQGAAIIRWAVRNGKKALFVTEKPDLFSDMYQDLADIGSNDIVPFVVNNGVSIVNKGTKEVLVSSPGKSVSSALYKSESDELPVAKRGKQKGKKYNVVMMTYSQAQSARTPDAKKKLEWVKDYAKDAIIICDESHNASGDSNRGNYFRDLVNGCEGVTFMSATFAKRPDNMILYALRSSIGDAQMTQEDMIKSIEQYGIPMQEILASALFKTGEMVRRERDFSDVKTHWDSPEDTFTEGEIKQSRDTYDKTIGIVNSVIGFQRGYIDPVIKKKNEDEFEEANENAAKVLASGATGVKVRFREYKTTPYASQVSNIANLMFYAIKAKKAAEMAVEQIKNGEKPIIAVDNTLESYIKGIEGDVPSADFAYILNKGLERTCNYRLVTTVKWINPETNEVETVEEESSTVDMGSVKPIIGEVGNLALNSIRGTISDYSKDKEVMPLMLSPIDYIKRRIEEAGYKCGEITGRSWQLIQSPDGTWHKEAFKVDKTGEIASFNGGSAKDPLPQDQVSDAIILNTAGSTGISLHASKRFGDRKKRTMIILQPARNVNTEVQVRGRGDRTGQVSRCEYFYITSPIPAEQKVIMMLKQKLASLDANSVGTENVSSNKVNADDMDNKYGDEIARQFLIDHPEINDQLDDPIEKKKGEYEHREGLLYELLIGLQRMTCEEQEMAITELQNTYKDQIEYLNQNGINDLATTALNLEAVTIDSGVFIKGKDNDSISEFAHDTLIERVEVNVLKKPLASADIYARMAKLGVLTEDGKIPDNQAYEKGVRNTAQNYADAAIGEKSAMWRVDLAKKYDEIAARTPRTDEMTDQEYDRLVKSDPEYNALQTKADNELERIQTDYDNQMISVGKACTYLHPGMPCFVPLTDDWKNGAMRYGRFIGFKVAKDGKPKSIKAVFAVTDARASIEIPVVTMSGAISKIVNDTYGMLGSGTLLDIGGSHNNYSITDEQRRQARDEWWDKKIPKNTTRQIRYMVTGNVFQACGSLGKYKGTITTYTKKDADTGEITVEKGMLLAEDFDPENFKVRSKVTKEDVWEGYDLIRDDVTNIAVRREGDHMVLTYDRPYDSRENLKKHPFMSDDALKALVVDNEIEPYSKYQLRAYVDEKNVDAVLDHLYKTYGFTKGTLFVMPDSTERVDAIVYSGKPFDDVIKDLATKYDCYSRYAAEGRLKNALKQYKMDINNEDLKQQIQDLVQLRQAYIRKDVAKQDSIRLAWSIIEKDETIEKSDNKDARDNAYAEREAMKEELAQRGIHGNAKHYKSGKVDFEEVEKAFNEFNKDKTNAEIAKRVFAIVKKLNLDTVFNEKIHASVGGQTAGELVEYNWKYMNAEWITDQMKADTILHELIHTISVYAKDCVRDGYEHLLSDELIDVVNQLDSIFSAIRGNKAFDHTEGSAIYRDYGITNWYEMMAEAGSNEEFRKDLAKITLGVKALSGMLTFSDVTDRPDYAGKKQNALEAVMERLDSLIDGFDEHAFTERFRGTSFGARNWKQIEESDNQEQKFLELKDKMLQTYDLEKKAQLVLGLRDYVSRMSDTALLRTNYENPGNEELEDEIAKRGLDPNPQIPGENEMLYREGTPKERRVQTIEHQATNKTLDSMSQELGIKINRVSRREMPKGHKADKGYYDTKTGEMTICMDNVTDERDAIATVLHETVGHHGLRKLFGARFNEAMTNIFSALDAKGREWVLNYMNRHGLKPGQAEDIIVGVEEYLSNLAEKGDFKSSVWNRVKDFFGRIIDKLFGTQGFTLTDNELQYILRASYETLKDPNWINTVQGKAMDTLVKRELGINNVDPTLPTDPEAEEAHLRWRDGDTGVANIDYESAMKDAMVRGRMEFQDADLPIRIGMDRIMKEVGKDKLEENEDYLTRHNQTSSRAETQATEFNLFRFQPLLEKMREVIDILTDSSKKRAERDEAHDQLTDYIYAVSGLERNNYKNNEIEALKQDALKAARDAAEEKMKGKTEVEKKAIASMLAQQEKDIEQRYEDMKRDWSGLTSLMGEADWRKAEDKARQMIGDFQKRVGNDALLNDLWSAIRACTDYSLEHAYKHGLLTREEFERLHGTATQPRMWEYYVPLRGFKEGTAEDAYNYETLTSPMTNSVVVKKMKGRRTLADDPIANIFNIAMTEIVQGNENWAKQALYRFVLDAGKNTLLSAREPWFVKNRADGTWSMAEPNPSESYEEFEERMKALQSNPGEPLAHRGRQSLHLDKIMANKAHRNEHLIRLKIGGVEKAIWVNGDPAIAQAVAGMDRANNMQLIRRASRALSNLFTTYSLDFTARNLIRDTIYSRLALIAKEDNAYRHQYKKNWWRNFGYGAFAFPMVKMMAEWESGKLQTKAFPTKREQMFMDFMRDGGQTGYTIVNTLDKIKRDVDRAMRNIKPGSSVRIPVLGHIAEGIRVLNEGFELLTRFTAYETSRDMGRTGQRSASDAKEISVNFNRRGAQTGKGAMGSIAAYFGATHYFFNAGVQGFENFLHLFKVAPVKMSAATAGFMAFGMFAPILNSMLAGLAAGMGDGDDDDPDWYWNLPEWVRRNNIVIGTSDGYLAIPLPVELRAFYGVGDIAASLMYHKYPAKDGFEIGLDVINTAMEILPVNPVEGYAASKNASEGLIRAAAPDALMFFVDVATNRDYTGRPLTKDNPFNDITPKSQAAYASTPKALVEACQWMARVGGPDLSPGVVRDFLKNYGGGLYKLAEDTMKLGYADEERPRRWDDIPFISGFSGHIDEDRSNSFVQNALYQYKDLSEKVVKDLNKKAGTSDITMKIAYEAPETLPADARAQLILEGEDYILGKMYYDGTKNKYQMKRRQRNYKDKDGVWHLKGELYQSKNIESKGIDALRKDWKDAREDYLKMPNGTSEEQSARAEASLEVGELKNKYDEAVANLVDRLMEEEYNHVQRRPENGIPYEPKQSLSERAYEMAKEIVK